MPDVQATQFTEVTVIERNHARSGLIRIALTAAVVFCVASTRSSAGLIVSDSYTTGSSPAAGQYVAGNALSSQAGLVTSGFTTGGYTSGSGTSNFVGTSAGLVSAADGATSESGAVAWIGTAGATTKSVARNLTPNLFNEGTTGTYWMSMLVSNVGNQTTTDGAILAGFGNNVAPTLAPGANLAGIYFGFSDVHGATGESDLVIRSRDTAANTNTDTVLVNGTNNALAGQTFLVVAEVSVNSNGSMDQVNWWVNPADLNSTSDLNNTSLAKGTLSTFAYQGASTGDGDFTRLTYASMDYTGNAFFDEARLGTSLASIAPTPSAVPEPSSVILTLMGGGLVGLVKLRRSRRPVR
jgi:PEP-CTERM motif